MLKYIEAKVGNDDFENFLKDINKISRKYGNVGMISCRYISHEIIDKIVDSQYASILFCPESQGKRQYRMEIDDTSISEEPASVADELCVVSQLLGTELFNTMNKTQIPAAFFNKESKTVIKFQRKDDDWKITLDFE